MDITRRIKKNERITERVSQKLFNKVRINTHEKCIYPSGEHIHINQTNENRNGAGFA